MDRTRYACLTSIILVASSNVRAVEPITPANVNRLTLAWTYDIGDSVAPNRRGKNPSFEATPAFADGRLYVSTPRGTVVALDADSGKLVWKTSVDVSPTVTMAISRIVASRSAVPNGSISGPSTAG